MSNFCLHCGHNIAADQPITIDEWTVSPTALWRDGVPVRVTPFAVSILHTLASAGGNAVSHGVISERAGFGNTDGNSLQVLICRLRDQLPGLPIETVPGKGYRWPRYYSRGDV